MPAILTLCLSGCISTSQFMTGRTLPPGRLQATIGVQNLVYQGDGKTETASDLAIANTRLALAAGLPGRFEANVALMPTSGAELGARWELTPPDLPVDAALGASLGTHFFLGGYWRGALTLSHDFHVVEPYVFAARYGRTSHGEWEDDDWFSDIYDELDQRARNTRTLGVGVSVPLANWLRVVPEYRYDWLSRAGGWAAKGDDGVGFLGIGLVFGPHRER